MNGRHFMINSRSIRNGFASFDGELFHHIVRVLRSSPGDMVTLVDEHGCEHSGVIDQVAREWVAVKIAQTNLAAIQESTAPRITVCQALPKGEKIDLILQKGTELGAHDFRLFGGKRSVARVREDQIDSKLNRWNRITAEAARQCGRHTIPPVQWFPTAVEAADSASHDLRLMLWESERDTRLKEVLDRSSKPVSIIVAIGPEGGFDPQEARHFAGNGFLSVSLGSRILRTETATIAIMAILQYTCDDI
jgi:16S rRNA (uracil1498-N3)-methyltransferase